MSASVFNDESRLSSAPMTDSTHALPFTEDRSLVLGHRRRSLSSTQQANLLSGPRMTVFRRSCRHLHHAIDELDALQDLEDELMLVQLPPVLLSLGGELEHHGQGSRARTAALRDPPGIAFLM
jgi:hypothetical protein